MDSRKLEAFAHKPPAVLLALLALAVIAFAAVHRLVNRFGSRQRVLAAQIYYQGLDAQRHQNLEAAIIDFRTALSYDPENYVYELSLAKALIADGHYEEARTYLATVAERAPQDGEVNLELARLAARDRNSDDAILYYHRAIYGLWSTDPDSNRRRTRLELVDYLLQHNQRMDAQSELLASAASLPPDPTFHLHLADRFLHAEGFADALDQYRQVIQLDRTNAAAHLGAGKAAFALGQYRTAQRYLQAALDHGVQDAQAASLLQTANLVLDTDPSRPNLTAAERRTRIVGAFHQAGERALQCIQSQNADQDATDPLRQLRTHWMELEPRMRNNAQRTDATTLVDAMETATRIEQLAATQCGEPQGLDLALLLIARNREGAER